MLPLIRWIFRPMVLIAISLLLVAAAVLIVLPAEPGPLRPQRLPLGPGDHEIAFIYPATAATTWDRFVQTVRRSGERLQTTYPGLKVRESTRTAPTSATSVAEVVLEWPGPAGRLVFRWYKLTSDWTPEAWIKELLRQAPYPLAIIGGNNSNWARELAIELQRATVQLPVEDRPLLLVTTATADRVVSAEGGSHDEPAPDIDLTQLYPDRTFRFCFSNRQMATAVTRFIWSQPDLRPQADPVYLVQWMDDSYSKDLCGGYMRVLDRRVMDDVIQQWGFVSGCIWSGLPGFALAGWKTSGMDWGGGFPLQVLTSVGSFSSPNPYEAETGRFLLTDLARPKYPGVGTMKRLLVVTGQAQPSRRFLRDLARSSPDVARSMVVASGDAIAFNTVYRDRTVTWPIQDLPFPLVFFCHRNPIDVEAGFRPLDPKGTQRLRPASHSGTEDLLLYTDIVEAVALAYGHGAGNRNAAALAAGLEMIHQGEGRLNLESKGSPLFSTTNKGMRNSGTGEHVVCLRPLLKGDRVLPEATIEVWRRLTGDESQGWQRVGDPLSVSYVERMAHGERTHGSR
jgi:hypothetical protein